MKKFLILFIIITVLGAGIYYLLKKKTDNNVNSKYSNCELGDLVGDDVERIRYKIFDIDYHREDFSREQIEKFAQECIEDNVKNQYQMDCCITIKMYPENK